MGPLVSAAGKVGGVIEGRLRKIVRIDSMDLWQVGDAIFIIRRLHEKYLAMSKNLGMASVDFEKAFDRVPREVVWWALRYLGVDEWIVSVIKAMYEDVLTKVRLNGRESRAFEKLKSNVDFHCRRCLVGENGLFQSVLLKVVVIEPNVKL